MIPFRKIFSVKFKNGKILDYTQLKTTGLGLSEMERIQ